MDDQRNIIRDESLDVRGAVANRQHEKEAGYEHGSYVPGENGAPGGIYIDKNEELRQQTANPHIEDIQKYLANMDDRIEAAKRGQLDSNEKEMSTATDQERVVNMSNRNNPEQADIAKVAEMFSQFEPTATGLAPANSAEARDFKEKMEAVESGKINLEDYQNVQNQPVPTQTPTQPQYTEPVQSTPERVSEETKSSEGDSDKNVVQFNVDADKADVFLTTLSPQEREKITRSNEIRINEINKMDIPVVTRTITSLDEFKKVLPRQSHSGVVETANVNSGYAITLKGCGAMALATLIPDDDYGIDYAKRFQLCYDSLVSTSIGKLSFSDFCALTHINDIPNMLFNILRASDPDDNLISIECGECHNYYTVPYKLSQLLDTDSISDEMYQKVEEIMGARNLKETADAVHRQSPIMNPRYVEFDQGYQKVIIKLLPPNGTRAIEVYPKLRGIMTKYSQFVAGLLPYIQEIVLKFVPEGDTEERAYTITDDYVMAQVISDLKGTCIQAIGKIMEKIPEYQAPTYSFKGKFVCPKCGRVETKVSCTVDSLIFYRVEQAIQ